MRERVTNWFMQLSQEQRHGLAIAPTVVLLLSYLLIPDAERLIVLLALVLLLGGQAILWALARMTPDIPQNAEPAIIPDPDDTMATHTSTGDFSTRLHANADGVVRAAQAINEVIGEQKRSANEQVDVIRQTNRMMEQFLELSEDVHERARAMTSTAEETENISQAGQDTLGDTINMMSQIRAQVHVIGETITRLAQLTREIDKIISSVSEIATQSNLLALNASIEAARAGTQGRGFAVVADEVRTLSQQSTTAANQVRVILVDIQDAVKETIIATQAGMSELDTGLEKSREANDIMSQLNNTVSTSSEAVRDIYNVIRQQSNGLEEISINISRINMITETNATSLRAVSTVSENLTRLTNELQSTVVQSGNVPTPS